MLKQKLNLQQGYVLCALVLAVALIAGALTFAAASAAQANGETYQNPLPVTIAGGGMVQSCADPAIIRGQTGEDANFWYMYCTTDPLSDTDKISDTFNFHLVPILRSSDLVAWEYITDVFSTRPDWVANDAGMGAPDIRYFNNKYHLYYTANWTDAGGSAIGVATSDSPTGPWTDKEAPVVAPRENNPGDFFWTFDSAIVTDTTGQMWIYYGSYYGGIWVTQLEENGITVTAGYTPTQVVIPNIYEGAYVIQRGGYYYLFGSATNCCNGPLTGYSVFVGRSESPTGPFVDKEGTSLLAGRVGGTPVLTMNGNRWVGMGHNAIFTDFAGQDWIVYHAIDQSDPYFEGAVGFTKRPVLMDPLDWVDGWPVARGGLFASDRPMPAPAARPGDTSSYEPEFARPDEPGTLLPEYSDEFSGTAPGPQWTWVREPVSAEYGVMSDTLRFETQPADLYVDSNNAPVLLQDAPNGEYMVETKVHINLPDEGCCYNYHQAGLVIYGDDDNFVKLTPFSNWETRQVEFAKEMSPTLGMGYPRYGNTILGTHGEWTYLRIVKRFRGEAQVYVAYTSLDGVNWEGGATWEHKFGEEEKIGLVSMGGPDFTANFEYVRVYTVKEQAEFAAVTTTGEVGSQFQFKNMEIWGSEVLWDFGDGITSTLDEPTHTYWHTGTFTVTLTITGEQGSDSVTLPAYITVTDADLYLPLIHRRE